jgi:hypothetical protein
LNPLGQIGFVPVIVRKALPLAQIIFFFESLSDFAELKNLTLSVFCENVNPVAERRMYFSSVPITVTALLVAPS